MLRWQTSSTVHTSFASLAEAKRRGWHEPRPDEYGGEQTWVRSRSGRVIPMVRGTDRAVSPTRWGRRGYDVGDDAIAHAHMSGRVGSAVRREWLVYRSDQVVPRARLASHVLH